MATSGQRFKFLRLEKNMKQEELAADFNKKFNYNFSKSAISQYENDKRIPEIDALIAFADYFDCSVDYLLGKTENKRWRLVTKAELHEFLPDNEVENEDWALEVDDLKNLSEETLNEIRDVLRKRGYKKK